MVGSLEGFVGETCGLPLRVACGGSAIFFGDAERELFRIYLRMYENFTGCQILSYCLMSNHFDILLEVPPMPAGGISDAIKRDDMIGSTFPSEIFEHGLILKE
jgi:hypothetical protein